MDGPRCAARRRRPSALVCRRPPRRSGAGAPGSRGAARQGSRLCSWPSVPPPRCSWLGRTTSSAARTRGSPPAVPPCLRPRPPLLSSRPAPGVSKSPSTPVDSAGHATSPGRARPLCKPTKSHCFLWSFTRALASGILVTPMALTVREAMALGGLRRGEVLAGAGGLDRTITWVKVLESPETISWLAEGELLLTVAFAIKDDQAAQKDLMRNLAAVGSAGLVIKPERYLPQIPDDMIGQADEFKIPLIRIPPDVSYLEIMNPILERIINAQNTQLRRSIEIHRQFTHLALDGQGLDAIVKTLGELVESSIALEDISFHLLASHVVPGVTDKHRQQTLAHHGTPLKVRQAAAIKNMLQDVVRGRVPHKVPPFPELGLTAPRIIAPVLAGRENLGYLSIIDHPQHLEELAMMAIEHAATVIALEMIKQREVAEAEDRVRGELVDDLLNGTFGDQANVQRRARHLRYDLSVPHRLLVVDVDHFGRFIRERRYEEGRVIALKHQLFQVVIGAVRGQHPRHLVSAHSDSVIVLLPQPVDGKDPESEYFFFFQAEDGIRDLIVTGVQTCALPI